jgi:PAS domain S-box-containing protein
MTASPAVDRIPLLPGDGEMARRMRELDWSSTGVGPMEQWPELLRTSVSMCLESAVPSAVWWGSDLITFYNDEYRSVLGAGHPAALGERASIVWAESWDVFGPMLAQVMREGKTTRSADLLLHLGRDGHSEEAYFSFSYAPVHHETGGVGGVFCSAIETTERVIGERRLRTLHDLAAQCRGAASARAVCESIAHVLAANDRDVPFALLYLMDDACAAARLMACTGFEPGAPAAPREVALDGEAGPWALGNAARTGEPVLLDGLGARFTALPTGAWKIPPRRALVLPIRIPGQARPHAILVAAVSPRRELDEGYRTFFELLATQAASGLADARAVEEQRRTASKPPVEPPTSALRRPRILWADDDAGMSDHGRTLLEPMYDVRTVSDGETALSEAIADPPDLVLADMMMPRMNGLELLRHMRTDPRTRDVPVILLSARAGADSPIEGLQAGADGYLVKPYSARELIARIGAHLMLGGARRATERRISRILESITDAFQLFDADWRITYMNPGAKRFFAGRGMDPDTMIGKRYWDDLFPLERDNEDARQIMRAMNDRVPITILNYHAPWDSWTLGRFDPLPDGGLANSFRDVTAQKRAEERLRVNEQRLEADLAGMIRLQMVSTRLVAAGDSTPLLLDIVDAAIDLTDADMGNIQLVDQQSGQLHVEASRGFEPPFLEHFKTVRGDEAACGTAMQTGMRVIVEDVESSPIFAGTPALPVVLAAHVRAVQCTPLFSRSGALVGVLSTHYREPRRPAEADLRVLDMLARQAADWIERTHAEEALRASEERFRRYFDLGLLGMAITSPSKGTLAVNNGLCAMLGYDRAELLQISWPELTHPDDLASDVEQFDRVMAGENDGYTLDKRWIRKDGRVIDTTISVNVIRRSDGSVDYFVALVDDVTERKHTEAALRESEGKFRALISQVKDYAIFATDERGIVTTWNEGCQEVLGYAAEEFVGLDSAALYTLEDRSADAPARDRRRAAETGTAKSDCWMLAKGGQHFFAMGATTALRDATGRLIGFSTVLRDLTQMKIYLEELAHHGESLERLVTERTDELQKTTERLRLSERMASLGILSAGLGHDMGNLLLPLEIRIRLLLDADLAPELREHVIGIQTCARYLQQLSSGLRLLAVDPWATQPKEITEVAAWWDEVGMMLKSVLPAGVQFCHELPTNDCWVAMARVSLTQAVFNLVHNAADSMRERGTGRVTVTVQEDQLAGTVMVRVIDDGPGMSDEVIRRCMEPYFSTKVRDISTGLGLPFVRGLVGKVGGQVEIRSELDRGTTISLILPLVRRAERTGGPSGRVAMVSLRDPRMRSFVERQLRTLGFDVRTRREKGAEPTLCVVDPPGLAKLPDGAVSWKPSIIVVGDLPADRGSQGCGDLKVLGRKPHADAITRTLQEAAAALDGAQG